MRWWAWLSHFVMYIANDPLPWYIGGGGVIWCSVYVQPNLLTCPPVDVLVMLLLKTRPHVLLSTCAYCKISKKLYMHLNLRCECRINHTRVHVYEWVGIINT